MIVTPNLDSAWEAQNYFALLRQVVESAGKTHTTQTTFGFGFFSDWLRRRKLRNLLLLIRNARCMSGLLKFSQ